MSEQDACGSEDKSGFIPEYEDVNQFMQQTLKSVLQATKCSNEMPASGDDFDFYSSYQGFQDVMNIEGNRILNIIQSILKQQNVKINLGTTSGAADVEDKHDLLMDANDQILERVGGWLDEASGVKKTDSTLVVATATPRQSPASWNKKSPVMPSSTSSFRLLSARNIQRPQLKFKEKVDNSRHPFIPIIKVKTWATISLEESLRLPEDVTPEMSEQQDFRHPHPYKYELDHLTYPGNQLCAVEPITPGTLEETPLINVNDATGLAKMLEDLHKQKEIAVDLEHHNYRTFLGITCLMQISTRSHDYIVDTLELRHLLFCLNEVFTNPKIVKVMHGSDSDIDWLQRDLGLYIVNMFDTGQASRVMNMSRFSLAHLLQHYCDVTADKQYQLADWRIRPLPAELQKYAREDTHYLLYIYDKMRNELIERGNETNNLTLSVLQRSRDICAKVYRKPQYTEEGYKDLYIKNKRLFNSRQLMALQELMAWRDETARMEDESYGYVLPNHMLLQICDILPRERQGILACCNPIPPLVRQYLNEIYAIIMKAREAPLHKVDIGQDRQRQPTTLQHPKYDVDSLLNCPHDLSHADTAVKNQAQSSLLDTSIQTSKSSLFSSPPVMASNNVLILQGKPILSVFDVKPSCQMTSLQQKVAELKALFTDPYAQYLPVDPKKTSRLIKGAKMTINVEKSKQESEKWKLMPASVKRKDPDSTADSSTKAGPPTKRSRTDLHDGIDSVNTHIRFEAEPEEGPYEKTEDDKKAIPQDIEIPLRFQLQPKKKNKKKNRNQDIDIVESVQKHLTAIRNLQETNDMALGQNPEDEKPRERKEEKNVKKKDKRWKEDKKKDRKEESMEEDGNKTKEEFKPYNYADGAKQLLKGKGHSNKDYFDPQAEMRKGKGPKVSKNKTFSKKGTKSLTWKT